MLRPTLTQPQHAAVLLSSLTAACLLCGCAYTTPHGAKLQVLCHPDGSADVEAMSLAGGIGLAALPAELLSVIAVTFPHAVEKGLDATTSFFGRTANAVTDKTVGAI